MYVFIRIHNIVFIRIYTHTHIVIFPVQNAPFTLYLSSNCCCHTYRTRHRHNMYRTVHRHSCIENVWRSTILHLYNAYKKHFNLAIPEQFYSTELQPGDTTYIETFWQSCESHLFKKYGKRTNMHAMEYHVDLISCNCTKLYNCTIRTSPKCGNLSIQISQFLDIRWY